MWLCHDDSIIIIITHHYHHQHHHHHHHHRHYQLADLLQLLTVGLHRFAVFFSKTNKIAYLLSITVVRLYNQLQTPF